MSIHIITGIDIDVQVVHFAQNKFVLFKPEKSFKQAKILTHLLYILYSPLHYLWNISHATTDTILITPALPLNLVASSEGGMQAERENRPKRYEVTREWRRLHRWVDNTKMDLQEVGWRGMEQIYLAQGTERWQALVNAVMHLRVP